MITLRKPIATLHDDAETLSIVCDRIATRKALAAHDAANTLPAPEGYTPRRSWCQRLWEAFCQGITGLPRGQRGMELGEAYRDEATNSHADPL